MARIGTMVPMMKPRASDMVDVSGMACYLVPAT